MAQSAVLSTEVVPARADGKISAAMSLAPKVHTVSIAFKHARLN